VLSLRLTANLRSFSCQIQKGNIRAKGSASAGRTIRSLCQAWRRVRIVKNRLFPIVFARFADIIRASLFLIFKKKQQQNNPNALKREARFVSRDTLHDC
jgi:hypothetical protein